MSTFTDTPGTFTKGNGPCNPPSAPAIGSVKSYTQLIEAYEHLTAELHAHVESMVTNPGNDPHDVPKYIAAKLAAKQDLLTFDSVPDKRSNNPVYSKGIAAAIEAGMNAVRDEKQDKLTFDDYPNSGSQRPVTSQGIYEAIQSLWTFIDSVVMSEPDDKPYEDSPSRILSGGVYKGIEEATADIRNFIMKFNVSDNFVMAKTILGSLKYILGEMHVQCVLDFTDWASFGAPFAGVATDNYSATSGAYILGMLSPNWQDENNAQPDTPYRSKSGRAYIKYINNKPMDAVIDYVVSYDGANYTGTIDAMVAKKDDTWEDLAFHIIKGTSAEGNVALYLAVSCSSFTYDRDSYPTVFRASGINFIPVSANGYVVPNNIADIRQAPICSVGCYNVPNTHAYHSIAAEISYMRTVYGLNGNPAFSIMDDGTVKFAKSPYIGDIMATFASTEDINEAMPVGAIVRWAFSTLPNNRYKLCNGATLKASQYTELAKVAEVDDYGNIHLPIEDNAIIRVL